MANIDNENNKQQANIGNGNSFYHVRHLSSSSSSTTTTTTTKTTTTSSNDSMNPSENQGLHDTRSSMLFCVDDDHQHQHQHSTNHRSVVHGHVAHSTVTFQNEKRKWKTFFVDDILCSSK
ncbi:hypothetical protein RDWZM_007179 [Blomia tropicalis]|uniref:Uncharacterized protein n=1 Tax=Blomia tropicalis TaxID=40697 RepID=A0A9Q0MB80_BLOTA|nr:hypothetical protein RDWZM_007179 [Blomia tropicalis]